MRTRRSWRNQERLHTYQTQELQAAAEATRPKREPPPILTDAEIDAMLMPKQSKRLLKLDMAKRRRAAGLI